MEKPIITRKDIYASSVVGSSSKKDLLIIYPIGPIVPSAKSRCMCISEKKRLPGFGAKTILNAGIM